MRSEVADIPASILLDRQRCETLDRCRDLGRRLAARIGGETKHGIRQRSHLPPNSVAVATGGMELSAHVHEEDERILQHGVSGFELFDERGLLVDGRHDSRDFTIDLRAHAAAGNLPRPAQVGCSAAQTLDRPDKGIVVAK